MVALSTRTRRELAQRSSDGMDLTLVWVQGDGRDGEDKVVVCVCERGEGAYFENPSPTTPRPRRLLPPLRLPRLEHVDYEDSRLAA
jgi:hypothetical protein